MQVDKEQKQAMVPVVLDDPAELIAGQDRELLNGPVSDLCDFWGLSARAVVTFNKLDVIIGADVAVVNMNKVHLLAGEKTGRRIGLLKEWCRLRLKELRDKPGPSGEVKSTEVIDVAQ